MKTGAKVALAIGGVGILGAAYYFLVYKPATPTTTLLPTAKPVAAGSSTNSTQQALNTANATVQAGQQLVTTLLPGSSPAASGSSAPPAQPSTFPSSDQIQQALQTIPAAVADKNFMAASANYNPNTGTFQYGDWTVYVTNNNPITFTGKKGSQSFTDVSTIYPAYMDNTLSGLKGYARRGLGKLGSATSLLR